MGQAGDKLLLAISPGPEAAGAETAYADLGSIRTWSPSVGEIQSLMRRAGSRSSR